MIMIDLGMDIRIGLETALITVEDTNEYIIRTEKEIIMWIEIDLKTTEETWWIFNENIKVIMVTALKDTEINVERGKSMMIIMKTETGI